MKTSFMQRSEHKAIFELIPLQAKANI